MGSSRWSAWLLAAIGLHCAVGVARIPHAVIGKRWAEVAEFGRDGEVEWRLRTARIEGAAAITTLRESTAEDAVVVMRGDLEDAIEFAPALLWPRLCCVETSLPAGADSYLGRPIAPWAIVGDGMLLRLEPR